MELKDSAIDDLSVLECLRSEDRRAQEAEVLLMPAVGLRCAVMDCMAAEAVTKLPAADAIIVSFSCDQESDMHQQRMRDYLDKCEPPRVRQSGRICQGRRCSCTAKFAPDNIRSCISCGGAELCILHHSTGVGNIMVCDGSW